jgi:F0F1-type ATP synthase assembly protein I
MTSLVRIYGSLVFLLVGAVLVCIPLTMKQDNCSNYLLTTYTKGGVFLIVVSLFLFVMTLTELPGRRKSQ